MPANHTARPYDAHTGSGMNESYDTFTECNETEHLPKL